MLRDVQGFQLISNRIVMWLACDSTPSAGVDGLRGAFDGGFMFDVATDLTVLATSQCWPSLGDLAHDCRGSILEDGGVVRRQMPKPSDPPDVAHGLRPAMSGSPHIASAAGEAGQALPVP